MNKKEVSEIRKVMTPDDPYCTLNNIGIVIVDAENCIHMAKRQSGALLTDRETDVYYKILKGIISTKLCKKFIEYDFPDTAYTDEGAVSVLFKLSNQGILSDDDICDFGGYVSENLCYPGPYALVVGHFTYAVRHRNAAGSIEKFSSEDYNFIVSAICPVVFVDSGFAYDFSSDRLTTATDSHLYVKPVPTDGFLFPAFNSRTPDVNSVMYYTSKPDSCNSSLIADVLGCDVKMCATTEAEMFKNVLKTAFGDDLDYQLLYLLNERFNEIYDNFKEDTKPVMVGVKEIANALTSIGCGSDFVTKFENIYNAMIGTDLHLINLIDNKIKMQTSEYTVTFNTAVGGAKVHLGVVNGGKTINLSTDDSNVEVNGIPIDK